MTETKPFKKLTYRLAVKAKCLQCCCGSPKEDRISFHSHCKRDCLDTTCEANIDIDNQIVIRKVTR